MLREVSIAGVYFPAIFFYFLASLVIYLLVDLALSHLGLYRYFWHKSLVQACLVGVIFSLLFMFVPLQ
ncbi:DUF1656 domain-containing protein [Xanthobacter sp. TB0139]|uniref:DUF1656 domain-containing protein n=1 Tax=Xanthobacter sp. TB0139 TaxID=3459178 RepID=UPI00403A41B0